MATRCEKTPYGIFDDGRQVYCYTLTDEKGQSVKVMNIGCTILEVNVLDREGKLRDVTLGFLDYDHYLEAKSVMGSTIGRCANRIADGHFVLNGKEYQLEKNERGMNHLHGGGRDGGFQGRYWEGEIREDAVVFTYHSPDGEAGYPGNLTVTETLTFRDSNLTMEICSTCDADTIVNYTNHAYYNLNGHDSGDVRDHLLTINAQQYSECGPNLIPVKAVSVEGTPFDFRTPHAIGERIDSDFPQVRDAGGYDVNFVLAGGNPAAKAVGTKSGIVMELYTDSTNMQLFSGIGMHRTKAPKGGVTYVNYQGFCLEPHAQPNAINTPLAEEVILRAGEKKYWRASLVFSVEK